ncbi:MAG: TIGR03756 family integrating conjugative element protein [Alphaproteobacteria bacterium]|nr:TIGR03756 family integrating conjugative element protein [Alphaproteobacteria bacterium]
MSLKGFALESTKPPHPLTTATLSARVLKKMPANSHYRVIGTCTWAKGGLPPKIEESPAVEQYLPDLVVTVSNNPGENPWVEAGIAYENKLALEGFERAFASLMGMPFDNGNGSGQQQVLHLNEERSPVVHVIGSPASFYNLPKISHQAETTFGKPYYSSHADAYMDKTEIAEIAYMANPKHAVLLANHEIGTSTHSWGPEIPRLMRVTQPSRFRASVVVAMHATDIVTNDGSTHVRQSTSNRCGPNCSVANVIYDPKQEKVIWQEVYPLNRNIKPGDAVDFGEIDDMKGNGNYVFVIWRKYRGCIPEKGKLVLGLPKVSVSERR